LFVPWADRLEKVKAAWSWLHLQLNKWLDSILVRFSDVITRVASDSYNRHYRHQYYYYLIAAHSTIIMSHGVVLQLYADFSRYIQCQQDAGDDYDLSPNPNLNLNLNLSQSQILLLHSLAQSGSTTTSATSQATPPVDYGSLNGLALSEGLSEFAIGGYGSAIAPLMQLAQGMVGAGGISSGSGSSSVRGGSSVYGSVTGSPASNTNATAALDDPAAIIHSNSNSNNNNNNSHSQTDGGDLAELVRLGIHSPPSVLSGPQAAINIQRDLFEMATIAWDGCVSTAEQLASILRGKHPKFVLLGGPPIDVFHEQVRSGDANILSQPGSAFNAPGSGPGADNPILSDPDFYMRLQPSTAWWMFLVAQVQVGHIKRLLKESEGNFKVSARRKALATQAAARATAAKMAAAATTAANGAKAEDASACCDGGATEIDDPALLGFASRPPRASDQMRPLSSTVNSSAMMLAT
ncbi:hypothetical protein H4S06_006147, partial [Coemansia sp. BCRC 34490]